MYICKHLYTKICFLYVNVYIHIFVYISDWMYVYMYTHIYTCIHIVYTYIHMCIHKHVGIHTYIHRYIHICIHTYIYVTELIPNVTTLPYSKKIECDLWKLPWHWHHQTTAHTPTHTQNYTGVSYSKKEKKYSENKILILIKLTTNFTLTAANTWILTHTLQNPRSPFHQTFTHKKYSTTSFS